MPTIAHGNFSGRRLVIFGAGYIGGAVASLARVSGASVTAITRNGSAAERLRDTGIETLVSDIAEGSWTSQLAPSPNLVVYCAGGGGTGADGYLHSYLHGMRAVLRWLNERGGAQTLVYTSSTSVYPQDRGVTVEESAPTVLAGDSRTGVLAATELELLHAQSAFARAFVLRLAGIYGPQRHALLDEIRSGTVSGGAEDRLNLIHRDDAVSAILHCLNAPDATPGDVFNVSDGAPATRGEIANWTAHRLGIPVPLFTGAPRGSRRPVPLQRTIISTKLQSALQWKPQFPTFREGYDALLRADPATSP